MLEVLTHGKDFTRQAIPVVQLHSSPAQPGAHEARCGRMWPNCGNSTAQQRPSTAVHLPVPLPHSLAPPAQPFTFPCVRTFTSTLTARKPKAPRVERGL